MNLSRRNLCCLLLVVCAALFAAAQTSAPAAEPSDVLRQETSVNVVESLPDISQDNAQEPQQTNSQPASPQSTPAPTASPTLPPAPTPSASEREKELQKEEQSRRILGVAPQFGVTRQDAAPLTPAQKFHLFRKGATDPFAFVSAGLQAGISQANNEFPGYGQGAAGYGKRYGASYADATSSNFFANFLFPVMLKEDPRYFRLGEGSIGHRIIYSLEQEFITHTDRGTKRFNFSNVLGAFASGGLSNAYYPSTDRGFGLTMSRSAISLGYGSLGGLINEFWIDIDQKLFHKKKQNPPAAMAPTDK